MTAAPAQAARLSCPYPGIEPFSYAFRDVFFARDAEAEQVAQKLVLHRTALLFAESGVGKSSLLNAGVIPRAIAHAFQPERIRVSPVPGQEFVVERIATGDGGFLPSLFGSGGSVTHEVLSAGAFLQRVQTSAEAIRGHSEAVRPLLIFDQFEEWTTLVQDAALSGRGEEARAAQRRIAEVILSLVRDRTLPVKIMLALREDYLGSLTPLFEEFPDFTDSYVRLEPLDSEDIFDAVYGPFTQGAYAPAIPMALAETIRDEFVRKSSGGPIRSTEVQIVCERLYLDVAEGKSWEAAYEHRKGVQGILEGHLEGRLGSLPSDAREQAVALLGCLLTADGTRNVMSEQTLLSMVAVEGSWTANSLRSTLRGLERPARLIVQSARRGVSFYEIASEFLVPWIRARTEERRFAREQEAAEQERHRAARQRKARVRRTQIVVGLVLALAAALFAVHSARKSMRRAEAVTVLDAVTQHAMLNTATDPQLGILLALHAVSLGRRTMGTPTLASVDALRQAMAATPRMRLRLAGHRGGIAAVDVSPGGEYIATASDDSTARIWDAESGMLLKVFDSLPGFVRDVAFSADGRSIATASDDTVRVWDAFRGRRLLALPVSSATSVAYSPDGSLLAAGDVQGFVQVWRLDGAGRPDTLSSRCQSIVSLTFSDDSARLAAGCFDEAESTTISAVIWSIAHPSQPVELRGDHQEVAGVAFSPDSRRLMTAGTCCPRVVMWDAASGKPLMGIPGHVNSATGVAFTPAGDFLATVGRDRTIRIVDAATGWPLRTISGHSFWIEDVAFFPDGKRLLTAGQDSTAVVWDVAAPSGAQLRALRGHTAAVQAVVASTDGRLVVSLDRAGQVLWWDAATGDSLRAGDPLSRWQRATPDMGLALGGDHLVMGTESDLSFWSVGSRRTLDSLVSKSVTAFALAGDSVVAAITAESSLILRNLKTGRSTSYATQVPQSTLMASSSDGRMRETA